MKSACRAKGKRQDLHSFTHALESISAEVKKRIFHFTWSTPDDFEILDIHTLTILWSSCADYEDLLHNLLSLCGRVSRIRLVFVTSNLTKFAEYDGETSRLYTPFLQRLGYPDSSVRATRNSHGGKLATYDYGDVRIPAIVRLL